MDGEMDPFFKMGYQFPESEQAVQPFINKCVKVIEDFLDHIHAVDNPEMAETEVSSHRSGGRGGGKKSLLLAGCS